MSIGEIVEKEFIDYVIQPFEFLASDTDGSSETFQKKLLGISYKIVGQSRETLIKNLSDNDPLNGITFNDMIHKIEYAETTLFQIDEKGKVLYKCGDTYFPIDKDPRLPARYGDYIHKACQHLKQLFKERISKIDEYRSKISTQASSTPLPKVRKSRVPKRQSFQLVRSDANLPLAHKILREGKFIADSISVSNFAKAFSGEPVSTKIIWNNTNALQYFIQELIRQEGIKRPNEGKWKRVIKCFCKPDGEFEVTELKNTKPPVSSKTNMLDLAIQAITRKD